MASRFPRAPIPSLLCWVFISMAVGSAMLYAQRENLPAKGLTGRSPTASLGFEQQRSSIGETQYLWRSSQVTATLSERGVVTLYGLGRAPLQITFPGANPHSSPAGEKSLERKTLYYLGERSNWKEVSNLDRKSTRLN